MQEFTVIELQQRSLRWTRKELGSGEKTRTAFSCSKKERRGIEKKIRRYLIDKDLEENVLNWIHDRRENMLRVSRKLIMKKAKILYEYDESVGDDLCAKGAFVF